MERKGQNVDAGELEKFSSLAADWWNANGSFKTLHRINPLRLDYVRRYVSLRNAKLLDVGCGGGIFAEAAASDGAEVTAIDLAPASIDVARSHAALSGLHVDYQCIGVERIAETRAGEFDVVTCFELLEHVPRPADLVSACAAAVRPGGALFFSTINRNPKSFLLAIVTAEHLLRMIPRGTHEYLKLIQPSELAASCRRAGLVVDDLTGLHYNPLGGNYWLGGNVDVNYLAYAVKRGS